MSSTMGINYDAAYGFTQDHWETIRGFAADDGRHLLIFRTGKEAAIPWIRLGFPAKPLSQKAKVDRESGILLAKTDEERQLAYQAGLFVLQGKPGSLPTPHHPAKSAIELDQRHGTKWMIADAVVDPNQRLALTSDYDLAAVIDCQCPDYFLTYGSLVQQTSRGSTNLWVDAVASELNNLFGSERIMHGCQSQYTGDLINLGWDQEEFDAAVSDGKSEKLLAFYPDGIVQAFTATAGNSYLILQDIITRIHPELIHAFRQ